MFTTSGEFQYFGCKICYESEIDIQQKLAKFSQLQKILILFLKQLGLEMFKTKIYNTLDDPFFCMEEKFGPLKKRMKKD